LIDGIARQYTASPAANITQMQITALQVQRFTHGSGFQAQGIRAPDAVLDPFLMIDHYRMSQPTFGAHPHAGFSAVTYMFDDAQTGFINHDSLGPASIIAPGDAHWSIAGAGLVHDEVPQEPGKTAHGLQLFINLNAATELQAPRALHMVSAQMPRFQQASGAQIKLAFGRYAFENVMHEIGVLPTDVSLFDVQLSDAGQYFEYAIAKQNAIIVPISGTLMLNEQTIDGPIALRGVERIRIQAQLAAHFVLLLGTPLEQPVVRHGPFALSSNERLRDAISRYQDGQFGSIQL
jgi:redox-sensitive bicupin YhaK (pirin superfamily)